MARPAERRASPAGAAELIDAVLRLARKRRVSLGDLEARLRDAADAVRAMREQLASEQATTGGAK